MQQRGGLALGRCTRANESDSGGHRRHRQARRRGLRSHDRIWKTFGNSDSARPAGGAPGESRAESCGGCWPVPAGARSSGDDAAARERHRQGFFGRAAGARGSSRENAQRAIASADSRAGKRRRERRSRAARGVGSRAHWRRRARSRRRNVGKCRRMLRSRGLCPAHPRSERRHHPHQWNAGAHGDCLTRDP